MPAKGGRPCPGDTTQVTRCNVQACPGKQLNWTLVAHLEPLCKLEKGATNYKTLPSLRGGIRKKKCGFLLLIGTVLYQLKAGF